MLLCNLVLQISKYLGWCIFSKHFAKCIFAIYLAHCIFGELLSGPLWSLLMNFKIFELVHIFIKFCKVNICNLSCLLLIWWTAFWANIITCSNVVISPDHTFAGRGMVLTSHWDYKVTSITVHIELFILDQGLKSIMWICSEFCPFLAERMLS